MEVTTDAKTSNTRNMYTGKANPNERIGLGVPVYFNENRAHYQFIHNFTK